MPRCGSTLLESILSMNEEVSDLGETDILETSFFEWIKLKNDEKSACFSEIYFEKIVQGIHKNKITTNKCLTNYQYAGMIVKQFPNAKIIHCHRNPFDNILSIYRAHFNSDFSYSSSLKDCSNVYIDQDQIMKKYKTKYKSKIFDLNYDLMVTKPKKEIKSLVSWLGWEWDDSYLNPHLNPRTVSTASTIQVRSPINSKSVGGWRNYEELLKPAIDIFKIDKRYQYLFNKK